MSIGQAVVDITANLSKFRDEVDKGASGALRDAGKSISNTGKELTAKVTLPIVGAGLGILKLAGDFQSSMNNVAAVTGATGKDFESLENTAKELGRTTSFSASEAAEGMSFLGMAGFNTDEIIAAMPATLNLAAASATDLGTTADIVSNVLTGFGAEANQAGHFADVLAAASAAANTDVEQLGTGMAYVAPVASGFGVSVEETTAALGKMSDAGIQGSMAGTSLRGILTTLNATTGKSAKALADLGIEVNDSTGAMRPLADIIEDLGDSGASTAEIMEIFGARAGPAMAALIDQGADSLRDLTSELEDSGGTAEEMASRQLEGLNGSLALLKSAFEGLAIAIADSGLLEWATEAVQSITGFVQKISEADPKILRLGVLIAGIAAAVGPVLVVLGTMVSAVGTVTGVLGGLTGAAGKTGGGIKALLSVFKVGPIGLVITAITLLVGAFTYAWNEVDGFKESMMSLFDTLGSVLGTIMDALAPLFETLGELVAVLAEAVGMLLGEALKAVVPIVEMLAGVLADTLVPLLVMVLDAVLPIVNALIDLLIPAIDALMPVVETVFGVIVDVISGAMDIISGVIETVMAVISGDWEGAWKGIQKIGQGVWKIIETLLSGLWDSITALFVGGAAAVSRLWNAGWNKVKTWFSSFAVNLGTLVGTMWGKIVRFFTEGPRKALTQVVNGFSKIRTRVSDSMKTVRTLISEGWKLAITTVRTRITSMVDIVKKLPDRIKNGLGNLGNLLKDAGKNVIQGLIDGIRGMIGNVGSAMGDIASKIRAYLPFSPAKEGPLSGGGNPEQSGATIAEMLGDGLRSGIDDVSNALASTLSPLAAGNINARNLAPLQRTVGSPAPAPTGAAPGGRGGVEVNQNFYGPTTSGGRLREIDWTLRYATQSRSETVGGVAT